MGTYNPTTVNTTVAASNFLNDDNTELTVTSATGFEVGRDIVFTSGPARGSIRRITGISGNVLTLDHALGTTLWRLEVNSFGGGDALNEELPTAGNGVLQSNTMAEWQAADADIVDEGGEGILYNFSDSSTDIQVGSSTNNVFVSLEDITLRGKYCGSNSTGRLEIQPGSVIKWGHVYPGDINDNNTNGYTAHGCTIIDTSSTEGQDDNQGDYHLYNTHIIYDIDINVDADDNKRTFWRLQSDDGNSRVRMADVTVDNRFAFRVEGSNSMLLNLSQNHSEASPGASNSNAQASIGFFNSKNVGHIRNITVRDSRQAVYHSSSFAGQEFTLGGLSFSGITDRVIRINNDNAGGSASDPEISELYNINFDEVDALGSGVNFIEISNVSDGDHNLLDVLQDFVVSIQDNTLSAITDDAKLAITDAQNTNLDTESTATGTFPRVQVRRNRLAQDAGSVNFGSSSDTNHSPIDYGLQVRGGTTTYTPVYLQDELNNRVVFTATMLRNDNVTEQNTATVDAYTELATAQNVYDYQWRLRYDSPYVPAVNQDFFTISGDVVTTTDTDWDVIFDENASAVMAFSSDTVTIKAPSTGYTGGIVSNQGDVTVNNTIQGDITCMNILHSFSDGDTIVSDGDVNATITLDAGSGGATYTISGGDVAGLTVNRTTGDTGTVTLAISSGVDGADDLSTGPGVEIQVSLEVTLTGADTTDGRLSFFDADTATAFQEYTGAGIADTEVTSSAHTEVASANVLHVVYSGGSAKDHREVVTLSAGVNQVSINLSAQAYPDPDENAADYNPTTLTYTAADTELEVAIERTAASTLNFGDGTFNNWLNTFVRGSTEYNELVSAIGADSNGDGDNAIDSIGSVSGAKVNGTYISITPGDNQTYNVGYVENTSSPDTDIEISRTVVDTGDSSITYTFNVVIPTEPAAFDLGTTVSSVGGEVSDILDDRLVTRQNVGNGSLGIPARDEDGDFVSPDL